jgi:hypothetical protein
MLLLEEEPLRIAVIRTLLCTLAVVTLLGAGCGENPNGQGLQEFGTISGRLVDDRTGNPIGVSPIYISVGSTVVSQVDNQGGFVIPHVPVGKQTVNVNAIGYAPTSFDVVVVKDQTSDAGYVKLVSTLAQ